MSNCSDSARRIQPGTRQTTSNRPPDGGWSRLSPIGLRAFFHLAKRWSLSTREQAVLLASTPATIRRWQRSSARSRLHRDQLERISTLMAIDAAIAGILSSEGSAAAWLRDVTALPYGCEASPLEQMLCGNVSDLLTLLSLLDYATPTPAGATFSARVLPLSR